MDGINWIYLLVGLVLGLLGSRINLLSRQPNPSPSQEKEEESTQASSPSAAEQEQIKSELEKMELAYQMARQMSAFKAGFLARTSHELRSPLNSLIGLHQLIIAGLCDSPEEEKEFVNQAHQSALKLIKLIDEIVDVSKLEHGTNRLEIRPLRLSKILENLYQKTHLQAANRNVRLQIVQPESEIYVLADYRRFLQLLVLFVDTAIAFMEEGSIKIESLKDSNSEYAQIKIFINSPYLNWSEPIDLLKEQEKEGKADFDSTSKPAPTPGMKLLLGNKLLETMQGKLVTTALEEGEEKITQLQCLIPLASPEIVAQELEES